MPRLDTLGSVEIRIYYDDTKKHRRPHFHAVGPDNSAVIGIPDLDVIEGDLDGRALARVLAWAQDNRGRVVVMWNQCNPDHPVEDS